MPKPLLLIVDDSPETVAGLQCFFEPRFEVLVAGDAQEGLCRMEAAARPVDLVITDLLMPSISGTGFIAIIRKRFPGLPVIAITGWVEADLKRLAASIRADVVMNKPFDLEILERHVCTLLARGRGG
jgi:two-component system cell cycle sensor histidine kinase/response regulator CckA